MTKRALISGITGQDGSYLAELLLEKGYEVHGIVRRSSTETFERIAHLTGQLELHQADLLDQVSLLSTIQACTPNEIHNLAAQSFVPTSWVQPSLTGEFTALGVTRSSAFSHSAHVTRVSGSAPVAIIVREINPQTALGTVVMHIPAVADLDKDPTEVVATGDWVKVDGDKGIVEVTKRD